MKVTIDINEQIFPKLFEINENLDQMIIFLLKSSSSING